MSEFEKRCKWRSRFGSDWLNLTVYLLVYYFCVFVFLIMSLLLRLQSLNSQYPYWIHNHGSIVGPGISKTPKPSSSHEVPHYDERMTYNPNRPESYRPYLESLNKCYAGSGSPSERKRFAGVTCTVKGLTDLKQVNSSNWNTWRECQNTTYRGCKPCSWCDEFGYASESPCFSIGVNRIFNWHPVPYDHNDLPATMPEYLKQLYSPKCVYITCEGDFYDVAESAANVRNVYAVTYFPDNCIPISRFAEFFNQTCEAKSVRVRFKIAVNVPVTVRCRIWAKNVEYNRKLRKGTLTFTVFVEKA